MSILVRQPLYLIGRVSSVRKTKQPDTLKGSHFKETILEVVYINKLQKF